MKERQKNLALISLIYLMFILLSCGNKANQKELKDQYGESWHIAKTLFYNNCSQCHLPRIKDSLFYSYVVETHKLNTEEKTNKFLMVLSDSNHAEKNIRINPSNKSEIEKYILFIETPQRKTDSAPYY